MMRICIVSLFYVSLAVHVDVDSSGAAKTVMRTEQIPMMMDLTAQYFNYASNLELPQECNYYGLSDLGRVVPDSCCSASQANGPVLDFRKDGQGAPYSCAPLALGAKSGAKSGPYVRQFIGCVNGTPTFGETCLPAGTALGTTYPMTNQTLIANSYANTATARECGCGANGQFPAIYNQTGCLVAVTGFMLKPAEDVTASTDRTATFVKLAGSCGMQGMGDMMGSFSPKGSVIGGGIGGMVGAALGGVMR